MGESNKLELNSPNKKAYLGQVFTPTPLAKFIVSLIKEELTENHRLLDPCIGYNAFFSQLNDLNTNPEFVGIELDEEVLTNKVKAFYAKPGRMLINESFFQYPITEKFDFIIQNPPYVRQELLISGKNNKNLITKSLPEEIKASIPAQSNLYIYFLMKSLLHLKNDGRLLALIYDSWLYSRFGESFKKTLLKYGTINAIYHFRHYGFSDASVGATVLDFSKSRNATDNVKIYRYENPTSIDLLSSKYSSNVSNISLRDFLDYRSNELPLLEFSNNFFTKIKEISVTQPVRGTTTLANKFFIHQHPIFQESTEFIKAAARIEQFEIVKGDSYILVAEETPAKKTLDYLISIKEEILKSDKHTTLKKQIEKTEKWYQIKPARPGNIIFNFAFRQNIDFFANEKYIYCSDNFYSIKVTKYFDIIFAILNSTLTKISILHQARSQGQGLKKIQLYEFNNVFICSHQQLSNTSLEKLDILGKELKKTNRFSIERRALTHRINEILVNEYKRKVDNNFSIEILNKNLTDLFK